MGQLELKQKSAVLLEVPEVTANRGTKTEYQKLFDFPNRRMERRNGQRTVETDTKQTAKQQN